MENEPSSPTITDRIPLLDALRGFALLGIFISIIGSFNSSQVYGGPDQSISGGVIGQFQSVFINLRFIGIFSLLFGLGIALLEARFRQQGRSFGPWFAKRMLVLAVFGLLNTTFVFRVEILLIYAVFGLLAFAVTRLGVKVALGVAAISFFVWGSYFELAHRDGVIEAFGWFREEYPLWKVKAIYQERSLWEMARLRWVEYGMLFSDNGFHLGMSLAMIILGYSAGLAGVQLRAFELAERGKKILGLAAVFSIGFALYAVVTERYYFIITEGVVSSFAYQVFLVSSLFCYVCGFALIYRKLGQENILMKALAQNGRLSLTGYVGGALLYSVLFYSFGFGLFGKMLRLELLLISVAAYLGFSLFAWLWLKRFRQGPLEWVYRKLTY